MNTLLSKLRHHLLLDLTSFRQVFRFVQMIIAFYLTLSFHLSCLFLRRLLMSSYTPRWLMSINGNLTRLGCQLRIFTELSNGD